MGLHTLKVLDSLCGDEKLDANETNAFSRELEQIKIAVVEYEYPTLKWDQFIPIEAGVDPGAETFTWYEFDRLGMATWISNYATDFPDIEEFGKKNNSNIQSMGDSYSWSIQDVRAAAKIQRPLLPRKARLAREAIERKIEHAMTKGDATVAIPGFAKNTNVSIVDGSAGVYNGDWDAVGTTGQMIYDDLNQMVWAVRNASYGVHEVTDILMGRTPFQYASTKSMTTLDSDSALVKFKAAHPEVTVSLWSELDLLDAGNDGPRIVAYEKNVLNVAAIVPVRFESLPEQPVNMAFRVPCHGRIGGTNWYRPLAGVYIDNILD